MTRLLPLAAVLATFAAPAFSGGYGDDWLSQPDPTDAPLFYEQHPEALLPQPQPAPPCPAGQVRHKEDSAQGTDRGWARPLTAPITGAINWGMCRLEGLPFAF